MSNLARRDTTAKTGSTTIDSRTTHRAGCASLAPSPRRLREGDGNAELEAARAELPATSALAKIAAGSKAGTAVGAKLITLALLAAGVDGPSNANLDQSLLQN